MNSIRKCFVNAWNNFWLWLVAWVLVIFFIGPSLVSAKDTFSVIVGVLLVLFVFWRLIVVGMIPPCERRRQ